MRTLVLFHDWEHDGEFVDPVACVSEVIYENGGDEVVEEIWAAGKKVNGISDAPESSFRTAWITISGAHELFEVKDLGTAPVEEH